MIPLVYFILFGGLETFASNHASILLRPGYVTKFPCEGRLFLSSVGNLALVDIQALPKELGCGVILKPLMQHGTTNLILETSTGTIERQIIIQAVELPSNVQNRRRSK